jgi:DNA-binding NtrC family response regulator
MAERPTVLVVDDDFAMRLVCRVNLEAEGFRVVEAEDAAQADAILADETVALVLADIRFDMGMDGVEFARTVRNRFPGMPIILMSGTIPEPPSTEDLGLVAFLTKPFDLSELTTAVRHAVYA